MRIPFFLLLFIPFFLFAQKKKIQFVYGIALNKGLERIYPEEKNLDVQKAHVLGDYISLGFNFNFDSTYLFYAGLRYGRENSRFRIEHQNQTFEFRTNNRPLSFIFAPGLKINKHHSVFINLSIVRVLHTNRSGGGGGERGGKQYTFSYTDNLERNSWEFRPGIKWQIKPRDEKKFAFEFGWEPSLLTRKINMIIKNPNYQLADTDHRMNYELFLFYAGIQF